MSTLHPVFKFPGSDDVVFDDVLGTRDFVADDLMVGVSVLTGFTTSGAIRTGVMTEMLPGIGIRFDNPDQNGIFWREMWQHLGDCECAICCEHMPRTMARLAAIRTATSDDDIPPCPQLRRTDSGSDYGFNGYPDCEFWERSGYEPQFIATAADYNGGPLHPRVYVADLMTQADKSLMDAATLRAWDRQWDDLVEAQVAEEIEGWGGAGSPGRASFMEPQPSGCFPLSPPRATARPAICPDAPARNVRLRHRHCAVSPIQPPGFDSVDDSEDKPNEDKPNEDKPNEDKPEDPSFWTEAVTVRMPIWQLGAGLLAVAVYMFMVVWQLEACKKCLRG
jgi:hypothetical protein